jgi:beta-lactamase superfamily II metal-dependent hydrolase/DNA/RNA endonuclease YhcR with UshA esterase domain
MQATAKKEKSGMAYEMMLTELVAKGYSLRRFIGGLIIGVVVASTAPTLKAEPTLSIYFFDIGQGNATLIISPTGKTLLVDGGRDGVGQQVIVPEMQRLGVKSLDYMVATHYDSDHIGGLDEVAAVFPPTIAYDGGDLVLRFSPPDPNVFSAYVRAVGSSRRTITPGTVLDLGGQAVATCIVVNGELISGGSVPIFGRRDRNDQPDNSASVGLLVQFGDFDLFIAGDLTGGGLNTTDVESAIAPLVGDVDVLQINHHGSRTSSTSTFLRTLKAEVGIIQVGRDNSFGHPSIEATDRFITTPPTSGQIPLPPDGNFAVERVPLIFQNEPSPDRSDASRQGLVADGPIVIETDGRSYIVRGGRLAPRAFPTDGAESGIRSDFPPSVLVSTSPVVAAAGQTTSLFAEIADDKGNVVSVTMSYSADGQEPLLIPVERISPRLYRGLIPGQSDGTRVEYLVTAQDAQGQETRVRGGYFAGITPVERLRVMTADLEPAFLGYSAAVVGVITVGSNTFSVRDNDLYLQDETGGINLFERSGQTISVRPGDYVRAVGRLEFFNGVLQLNITNPTITPPFVSPYGLGVLGRRDLQPLTKTISQIGELTEGLLVRIEGVRISGTLPPSGNANLTISDGTGSLTLRILGTTNIPGMSTPAEALTIIGVIGQFDGFRPFNRGYQILPRSRDDFVFSSSTRGRPSGGRILPASLAVGENPPVE